jgi:hypothetical protein
VLRANADVDTVRALGQLGSLETFGGMPDADRLTNEALVLGQGLDLGPADLCALFMIRGIWFSNADRNVEAIMNHREAVRLAELAGASHILGISLLNLSSCLAVSDSVASADVSRRAMDELRRLGDRYALAIATGNLSIALLAIGDWDGAAEVIGPGATADGLDSMDGIRLVRIMSAALRGKSDTAERIVDELDQVPDSEDPQEKAGYALALALTAMSSGQQAEALRHARDAVGYADVLGLGHDAIRWAWPVGARAAHDLGDSAAEQQLVDLLDGYLPGRVAPMVRAERDLARARLTAGGDDGQAAALFTAAIASLRTLSTPYHLAHGLLDQAQYLFGTGDEAAAGVAVAEAKEIGERLGCPPLLARADRLQVDSAVSA